MAAFIYVAPLSIDSILANGATENNCRKSIYEVSMLEVKWPHEVAVYCSNNISVNYIFISIEKLPVTYTTNITNIIQAGPTKQFKLKMKQNEEIRHQVKIGER